jgi:hypothetical protein
MAGGFEVINGRIYKKCLGFWLLVDWLIDCLFLEAEIENRT